jgi:putative heme-binding domain-containing protein
VDALEAEKIPAKDIPVHIARQIASLPGNPFGGRIEKAWGSIRPATQDKVKRLAEWKTKLAAIDLAQADRSRGEKVYEQSCGACHKLFGKGAAVGPDLTGGQRQSLDYWAENLVDPSAIVPKEYKLEVLELKNGRVISGAIQVETPKALTVRTTTETFTIDPADLESRKVTNQSLMPEGQLERFSPQELVDLLGYLMSKNEGK